MTTDQRIRAFRRLGDRLRDLSDDERQMLAARARNENSWFTPDSVTLAIEGISKFLDEKVLSHWLSNYAVDVVAARKVAIIMAGNIPLVGFHDLMAVLLSGHHALIKLSSKDSALMRFIIDTIIDIEPAFRARIEIAEQLKGFDAIIATGSDNSARYFNAYFGKYPNIIRKNRTSVAILDGFETKDDLQRLGKDVFSYFGLGCRNVSKLFVPRDYDFVTLLDSWVSFRPIIDHHKYCNNYDYQKSILLVNKAYFLDNGFVLLVESDKLVSPISVLYYTYYNSNAELREMLGSSADKIQCVVGNASGSTGFGDAQLPAIDEYADGVDTMKFLLGIGNPQPA